MAGPSLNVALKPEGESTGEVTDGRRAAISGSGTERYHIKAAAAKHPCIRRGDCENVLKGSNLKIDAGTTGSGLRRLQQGPNNYPSQDCSR